MKSLRKMTYLVLGVCFVFVGITILSGCDSDNFTSPSIQTSGKQSITLSTDDPDNPIIDEGEKGVSELPLATDIDDEVTMFPLLEDDNGSYYEDNGEKIYLTDGDFETESQKYYYYDKKITTPGRKGYVYTKIKFPTTWTGDYTRAWVKINFGSWYSGKRYAYPLNGWSQSTFVVRSTHKRADRVTYRIRTNGKVEKGPWHSSSSSDWSCWWCKKYKW